MLKYIIKTSLYTDKNNKWQIWLQSTRTCSMTCTQLCKLPCGWVRGASMWRIHYVYRLFLRIQIHIFFIMRSAVCSSLPLKHCTTDTTAVNINTANANVGHTHCPGKIPQCSQERTCTSRSACCSVRHSGTRTAQSSSGRSDSPGTVGCRSVQCSRRRTHTSPFPHRRCPRCRTGRHGHSWGRTPRRDNLNVWSEKISVSLSPWKMGQYNYMSWHLDKKNKTSPDI